MNPDLRELKVAELDTVSGGFFPVGGFIPGMAKVLNDIAFAQAVKEVFGPKGGAGPAGGGKGGAGPVPA